MIPTRPEHRFLQDPNIYKRLETGHLVLADRLVLSFHRKRVYYHYAYKNSATLLTLLYIII